MSQVNLSTRPDKFVGSMDIWEQAEAALKSALQHKASDFCRCGRPGGPGPTCMLFCVPAGAALCAGLDVAREPMLASNICRVQGWGFQEDVGGGAFYGPKIDIKICDAIGRKWQCSTVQASAGRCARASPARAVPQVPTSVGLSGLFAQLDFNLPERFDMFYIR